MLGIANMIGTWDLGPHVMAPKICCMEHTITDVFLCSVMHQLWCNNKPSGDSGISAWGEFRA